MLRNAFCDTADESVPAYLHMDFSMHTILPAVFQQRWPLQYYSPRQEVCSKLAHAQLHIAMNPYGVKIADAVAPTSFTASETFLKTGNPRCVVPAFFGFVPPTTLVP